MLVVEKKHFVEFHAKILVCYKLDHDGYYEFPQFSQWLGAKYTVIEKMMTEYENMFSSLLNEKAGTVTNLVTT